MLHNLIARLKATPPWVWISIAIAAAALVISFLIYRNSQNGNAATAGPVNPGDTTGGYSPYGNNGPATGGDSAATNSLLQQIIDLLKGGSGSSGGSGGSGGCGGSGGDGGSGTNPNPGPPPAQPVPMPASGGTTPPVPAGPTQAAAMAPSLAAHPVPGMSTGVSAVPASRPVLGAVAHADAHRATMPHAGAVLIGTTPHPWGA